MHISDACSDTGTTLAGGEGHVWMNAPLYKDNIYCQWQINVEFGKVSIAYSLMETNMTYFRFWRVTNMCIFWKRYAVSSQATNAPICLFAWQPLWIFKMPEIESRFANTSAL